MATLPDDINKKKLDDSEDPSAAAINSPGNNPTLPTADSGSVGAAQPSSAGIGPGGTNGWTNIQAYLGANAGNTSSADNLKKIVGDTFNSDIQGFNSKSQEAIDSANKEVSSKSLSNDDAQKYVNQAGQNYQYNGAPNEAYQQAQQGLTGALSASYGGPTEFNYGLSADTQNYGSNLGTDDGFQGIMHALYGKAAGRGLTTGQFALQDQLDTNDPGVAQNRSDLKSQYGQLQNDYASTSGKANDAIKSAQSQLSNNQAGLRDFLKNDYTNYQDQMNQAVSSWNNEDEAIKRGIPGTQTVDVPLANGKAHIQVDPSLFLKPGGTATSENITGQEGNRNNFNAIMDALGLGQKIAYNPEAPQHSVFDSDAYNRLINSLKNGNLGSLPFGGSGVGGTVHFG